MNYISGFCILRDRKIISDQGSPHYQTATVEAFCKALYDKLQPSYPKFYKMDMQSRLGFLASEILLHQHPVNHQPADATAVVLSNSTGSLDTDIRFEASRKNAASPSLFVYTLPNIVVGEICIYHDITGENAFFITPTFDAAVLTEYIDQVMQQKHTLSCIAGWVNVLGEHHDVFLYLAEKEKRGLGITHTPDEVEKMYHQ
jgi:hypothetical protein